MRKVLDALGVLFVALLVFVGLVHVLIRVQGKNSPETLTALHDMPVIGGFFMPPEETEENPDPEEVSDLRVQGRLRESLELYGLPPGFTREELESLAHDLASAKTENEQLRLELEREREALAEERREIDAERKALEELAKELEERATALQARHDELDQQQNLLLESEERNLRTIRAMFEKMDPKKAAEILEEETMDLDTVAKILAGMSERSSAGILEAMETTKAVEIMRRMQKITSG